MAKRLNHLYPPKCAICGGPLPTNLHTVYCADPECVLESYRRRQRRYYWRKRHGTVPPSSPEAPPRACLVCGRALAVWSISSTKTGRGFCCRVHKAEGARAGYYRRQAASGGRLQATAEVS